MGVVQTQKKGVVGDSAMLSQNFLRPCNQVSFSQILRIKTGLLIGLLAFKTRFKPTFKNTDCGICCRWFSVQYIQKNMKNTKTCPQPCLSRVDCCGDMLATPALTGRTSINFVGRKKWEIFGQPRLPVTRVQIQSIWQVGKKNISTCWMGQVTKERLGRNYATMSHMSHMDIKLEQAMQIHSVKWWTMVGRNLHENLCVHPGKCPAVTTFQDGIFFSIKVAHLSTRNDHSINFCADLPKCPFRSALVRIGERMGLLRNDARDLSPLLHDHCRMIIAAKTMEPADSRPDH